MPAVAPKDEGIAGFVFVGPLASYFDGLIFGALES